MRVDFHCARCFSFRHPRSCELISLSHSRNVTVLAARPDPAIGATLIERVNPPQDSLRASSACSRPRRGSPCGRVRAPSTAPSPSSWYSEQPAPDPAARDLGNRP